MKFYPEDIVFVIFLATGVFTILFNLFGALQ